jgi:hypothetical protein
MKTVKILCTVIFATLLLAGCQKDEDGYRISYYKDKIGVGYVFYKNDDGSISPIRNYPISIIATASNGASELFYVKLSHTDIVTTDETGKFTCKFVKEISKGIEKYYMLGYYFDIDTRNLDIINNSSFYIGGRSYDSDFVNNFDNNIIIDTFYFKHRYTNDDF